MRHLWFVPTLHLPVERNMSPSETVKVFGVEKAEQFERSVRCAWEAVAREVFRTVAEFARVDRVHVFAEGMLAHGTPEDPFRFFYEDMAAVGSIQMRIALGLESLGAQLHAVDSALISRTPLERALNDRHRDENFAWHIMKDVPDGHAALLMIGAGHNAERLIRERSDFTITRIGTLAIVYEKFFAELLR